MYKGAIPRSETARLRSNVSKVFDNDEVFLAATIETLFNMMAVQHNKAFKMQLAMFNERYFSTTAIENIKQVEYLFPRHGMEPAIRDKIGKLLMKEEEILERWKYFEDVPNVNSWRTDMPDGHGAVVTAATANNNIRNLRSRDERRQSVEMYNYTQDTSTKKLHDFSTKS